MGCGDHKLSLIQSDDPIPENFTIDDMVKCPSRREILIGTFIQACEK